MRTQKNGAGNLLPKVFTFNPSNQPIRVEIINSEPCFVAKDICDALCLKDTEVALRKLDDDEKLMRKMYVSGQNRNVWCVNESGLYNLIFRSNKPEAKAFRKWVTSEVLPSLRQTGKYELREATHDHVCRSTLWRYRNGLVPATTRRERCGEFADVRNLPFGTYSLNGYAVKKIDYDDETYYSIVDVKKALHLTTDTGSIANSLNVVRELARKLFLFGTTSPSWFCTSDGLQLLLCHQNKRIRKQKGGRK